MAGVGIHVGHCPEWITDSLLERILQGEQEETTDLNRVVVYQVKADPAVAKGENFSCQMTRVSVKYTKGHKTGFKFAFFIFKSDLAEDFQQDVFFVFQREKAAYNQVLPKVYNLLKSIGDDTCKLSPECIKIDDSGHPRYFVFEDLKHLGYCNVNRQIGLDVCHLTLAIKKLAKWHAATAHLAMIDPPAMDSHNVRNVSPEVTNFHAFFKGAMNSAGEAVRKWPGCENYGEKLCLLSEKIIERCCEVFTRDEASFNVLTHGDMWMSNIMFKNDLEGKPVDAVFVDYACGFFGSPGIDLSYLLFTSNAEENTEAHWDGLLRIYHSELVLHLKRHGFTGKIPTLLDIYIEYLRKSHYAIMISSFLIPLRLIEDTANSDLGSLLGDSPQNIAFREMLFGTPKYRAIFEPLLRFWDSKGLLDV